MIQLIRTGFLSGLILTSGSTAAPSSFDECLKNLRSGPDSFLGYLCLGTPGLPERGSEVMAVLRSVLRRKPAEPHARVYLALMRLYRYGEVEDRDFTEPLAVFERNRAWPDLFLAQLAFVERSCLRGLRVRTTCAEAKPLLEQADRLARSIGDPGLVRLAAIARMRWNIQMQSFSAARRAEKDLDSMPGHPPAWLRVLEAATRARFASQTGDEFRARDLYAGLLAATPSDSASHAAALAGVAGATTRMAFEGLADRREAEHLLRTALAAEERLGIVAYNGGEIGTELTRAFLVLLLGRTPETLAIVHNDPKPYDPRSLEVLLQGPQEEQRRALDLARALPQHDDPRVSSISLARAHVELAVGSASEGMRWGDEAIQLLETRRSHEEDDEIRMKGDSTYALVYRTYLSDLLDRSSSDSRHLEKAWRVSEQLRARVLLETLLSRKDSEGAPAEPIPELADLRSALHPGEALVSFLVWSPRPSLELPYTRGHSYALILTQEDLLAVRIAQGETLEPAVKAWGGLLGERRGSTEPGARRLYEDVLRPVLHALPPEVQSLTLVPDGPLHGLAFDALSETGRAPYVADRYRISIVPSASVWLRLRKRPRVQSGLALALASTPEGGAVGTAETRGDIEPGQLAVLLHTREEAQEAVDAFPGGSLLVAGHDATPERLSPNELRRVSLVHFAVHGVANAREPDESFLLLAPGASGSGKLKVADVSRFDWTGKTIVLSACDTSVGPLRIGEGVLSLARGFFAGGASAVIGTLSRVRDDDQRALFHAFYAELRRGVSVGEAMAAAKRALIRSGAPPAAWANVIVLGDATVHPRAPDPPSRRWWPVAALGAAVVVALGVRARSRRSPLTTSA
ncbi:MAG TPA: CHAT domain-containing protein [Myxococcaceae bacterium]|nr:CHAT domain-containing protein [Myxococcaceae bacterium]